MAADLRDDLMPLVERCLAVLHDRPSALLTDIDGTISPIAPTPQEATVEPEARFALERIAHQLDVVGVVTGRALDVATAMVNVPSLAYIGNHGLERLINGEYWDHPQALASQDAIRAALAEIGGAAARFGVLEGLLLEDKQLSGTIHYRQAPDIARVEAELGPEVQRIAEHHGLRVTKGRMIWELRPAALVTKGTAIADLIDNFHLRGVVFIGDDTTDVDGFRVVGERRASGSLNGLRIAVFGPESPVEVREESDVQVPDVATVVALLSLIADRLESEQGAASRGSVTDEGYVEEPISAEG